MCSAISSTILVKKAMCSSVIVVPVIKTGIRESSESICDSYFVWFSSIDVLSVEPPQVGDEYPGRLAVDLDAFFVGWVGWMDDRPSLDMFLWWNFDVWLGYVSTEMLRHLVSVWLD
ncbi:hypothetical protein LIER_03416 [Lithospermum erythrorhizon]|uniref:Uncharacterized protein n=1 Tax=Lithospermum erythrorhizon TaxID=34254 RepID=A0AAV3NT17_LITER